MSTQISGITILNLIRKKSKLLALVGITSFILSAGVSLILPVYYKSTSTLYPYNPEAYDPRSVWRSNNPYGSSADADRIIAIAKSREVLNYIAEKYNLMHHYGIDPTDKLVKVTLTSTFEGNLSIVENDLSAIEISFFDTDPDTAAMIVNDIVHKTDEINKKPLIDISQKLFEATEKLIREKYNGIDSIQKILDVINFNKNYTRSEIITSELLHAVTDLNSARNNMNLIQKDFSTMNVIERAEPVAKKAKPQRLLIVLVSVALAEVMAVLVLLLVALKREEI